MKSRSFQEQYPASKWTIMIENIFLRNFRGEFVDCKILMNSGLLELFHGEQLPCHFSRDFITEDFSWKIIFFKFLMDK